MWIPIFGALFSRFPVDVEIFEKREVGFCIMHDKGRRRFKDGKYYYELKNAGVKTKPINPEHIYISPGGKHTLKLYSEIPGVYQPVTFVTEKEDQEIEIKLEDGTKKKIETKGKFKIIDEDSRRWLANDAQEAFRRFREKRSFLEVYAPMITMISFCVIFIMVLVILNGNLEHLANIIKESASVFEKATSLLVPPPY